MNEERRTPGGLEAIFWPESIAIIGASSEPGKVGHDIFANILKGGYRGTLFPVNPRVKSILSVKCFPAVGDIPDQVDLAIMVLPPLQTLKAVQEAVETGVRGIIIVSAGFREAGSEGLEIENRIVSICREAGVRVVGPNCLGVINPVSSIRMNASFSARMPQAGRISFVSQSGALCTAVLDFAADRDFGFSKFISIGNKADVDELDLLRYLHEDPDTSVIMLYLEEVRRGSEFIEVAREITMGRHPLPILVIKSGRTRAGAQAAASHTGALAGSEAVFDAIFKQSGIIRADTIDELFDYANAFNYKQESTLGKLARKLPTGRRVAIITNAGGPGIIATDMTVSSDLELATFQQETVEDLAQHLPQTANLHNPVDVIGDATQDRYENALRTVINDPGVDGALVILTPQSMTNSLATAEAIVRVARRTPKPILCCFMGIIDVSAGVKFLQEHGYPVYKFPENTAKAFAALYKYSSWLNRERLASNPIRHETERASQIIRDNLAAGRTYLSEIEGLALLNCYGFPVLPTRLASSAPLAADIASELGFPVVMKVVSDQIIHKSDAGGVVLGIPNRDEAMTAYNRILENASAYKPDAQIRGVLVQKMAAKGEEVIIGMQRYEAGPLLMFGLGGIFVEIFRDVVFRLAPIDLDEAHQMVNEIRGYRLLTGFRGRPKADVQALERTLVSLSDLVVQHPEIREMDINPLLVHEDAKGVTVADCRIILQEQGHKPNEKQDPSGS